MLGTRLLFPTPSFGGNEHHLLPPYRYYITEAHFFPVYTKTCLFDAFWKTPTAQLISAYFLYRQEESAGMIERMNARRRHRRRLKPARFPTLISLENNGEMVKARTDQDLQQCWADLSAAQASTQGQEPKRLQQEAQCKSRSGREGGSDKTAAEKSQGNRRAESTRGSLLEDLGTSLDTWLFFRIKALGYDAPSGLTPWDGWVSIKP